MNLFPSTGAIGNQPPQDQKLEPRAAVREKGALHHRLIHKLHSSSTSAGRKKEFFSCFDFAAIGLADLDCPLCFSFIQAVQIRLGALKNLTVKACKTIPVSQFRLSQYLVRLLYLCFLKLGGLDPCRLSRFCALMWGSCHTNTWLCLTTSNGMDTIEQSNQTLFVSIERRCQWYP